MNTQIVTKLKINKPANDIFEAIVDPDKIGNFWFSSSSNRWEQDMTITLRYDEYNAEGSINIIEIKRHKKIVFSWGEEGQETIVTITLSEVDSNTMIEVIESGLKEDDPELIAKMIGQKEGWVYMLTCLKGYLENGTTNLKASIIH